MNRSSRALVGLAAIASLSGFGAVVEASPAPAMRSGPTLTNYSLSPDTVDTNPYEWNSPELEVHLRDPRSPIKNVAVDMSDCAGNDVNQTHVLDASDRVSGTATNGDFMGPLTVGPDSPNAAYHGRCSGVYDINTLTVTDKAGRKTVYSAGQLSGYGPSSFTLVNVGKDTVPPTASSVSFSPSSAGILDGPATIQITMKLTDTTYDTYPAGVWYAEATIVGPDGTTKTIDVCPVGAELPYSNQDSVCPHNDLIAGNPDAGTYRVSFTMPADAKTGVWKLDRLVLADQEPNTANLTGSALRAEVGSPSFKVVDGLSEITGLHVSGGLSSSGAAEIEASWTLPAHASGAKACLTKSTKPASSYSCAGGKVIKSPHLSTTWIAKPGANYSVSVFAIDSKGRHGGSVGASLDGARATIARTPTQVAAHHTVTVSGTLTDARTHKPVANATVALWEKTGSKWKKVATIISSSKGKLLAVAKPASSAKFEWRFAGKGSVGAVVSPATGVIVL